MMSEAAATRGTTAPAHTSTGCRPVPAEYSPVLLGHNRIGGPAQGLGEDEGPPKNRDGGARRYVVCRAPMRRPGNASGG